MTRQVGMTWGAYVQWLVAERGSLAQVAEDLAAARGHKESLDSIERGLRRLRNATAVDGGVWGQRVLKRYGLPGDVVARLRWMALYHSRFPDLPVPIARDLLRVWEHSLVRNSALGVYLDLAAIGLDLRAGAPDAADARLSRGFASAPVDAQVEAALVRAFRCSRTAPDAVAEHLDAAGVLLDHPSLSGADRACFQARWVDQRAYPLNRGPEPDHAAALALYETLPDAGPAFARCRRHNGLGWSLLRLGQREAALVHANASVRIAGDGGHVRLRSMALRLRGAVLGADADRQRAASIAADIEDELLLSRYRR